MPKAEQSLNELLHEIRRVEKSREVLTEKKIREIYQQLLKELNHFLADEYLKYSQDGILTVIILQEKSRYAKFFEEIEANVNDLTPEIASAIKKTVEDTYTACYKGMSDAVLNAKDTKSALEYLRDLDVRPEVMKRAIENPISGLTLHDILEKNRKEVIYDIKRQVNISLMNGDRYETADEKLVERLDFSYGKAANIVRTETHRVTESGFMDCAKDISSALNSSEFVYTAIWRTMKDERVRPQIRRHTKSGRKTEYSKNGANHQKMEGKIIQAGDKFQLGPDVFAECPGNSGTARNDCRCRCFLEYDLLTKEEFVEKGGKLLDKSGDSGIIEIEDKIEYQTTKSNKVIAVRSVSGEYEIKLPDGSLSTIKNPVFNKYEIFAGKGSDKELRVRDFLTENYGGTPENWFHAKGYTEVVDINGAIRKANVHWFEESEIGIKEMKVKGWSKK